LLFSAALLALAISWWIQQQPAGVVITSFVGKNAHYRREPGPPNYAVPSRSALAVRHPKSIYPHFLSDDEMRTYPFGLRILPALILLCLITPADAEVIFSNDFESDTTGFVVGGSLPGLSRVVLPTDSGGPNSSNKSMWLGKLGDGIGKGGADEIITLPLTGLQPGTSYTVSFDLLIGASWDGAAGGYGPDSWRFAVDGTRLVDTIFSNVQQGVDAGAYSPQRYTDTQYTNPNGPDVPRFSGADASYYEVPGYANDYAIYYFGHGAGNPVLSFQSASTSATLEFARYGNTGDSADEYWALDNVVITGATGGVIPGDYNQNGVVDAADYVVWRDAEGTTNTLPNDLIGGTIGQPQYNQWRTHFGQTAGSGAGASASAAVPEPATLVLLMFAAAGWCLRQGRNAKKHSINSCMRDTR
jgi:PEP-CTERM motif